MIRMKVSTMECDIKITMLYLKIIIHHYESKNIHYQGYARSKSSRNTFIWS